MYSAAIEGRQLFDTDIPEMISSEHVSHCVDLIRQILQCQPDLTVEIKNEEGGVTGFGTAHQCYDWDQLMSWMETWETYGQTEAYNISMHHHHKHLNSDV